MTHEDERQNPLVFRVEYCRQALVFAHTPEAAKAAIAHRHPAATVAEPIRLRGKMREQVLESDIEAIDATRPFGDEASYDVTLSEAQLKVVIGGLGALWDQEKDDRSRLELDRLITVIESQMERHKTGMPRKADSE